MLSEKLMREWLDNAEESFNISIKNAQDTNCSEAEDYHKGCNGVIWALKEILNSGSFAADPSEQYIKGIDASLARVEPHLQTEEARIISGFPIFRDDQITAIEIHKAIETLKRGERDG